MNIYCSCDFFFTVFSCEKVNLMLLWGLLQMYCWFSLSDHFFIDHWKSPKNLSWYFSCEKWMLRSLQILDTSVVFYDIYRYVPKLWIRNNGKEFWKIVFRKIFYILLLTDFKVKTASRLLSAYIYLDKNDKFFNGKFLWSIKTT